MLSETPTPNMIDMVGIAPDGKCFTDEQMIALATKEGLFNNLRRTTVRAEQAEAKLALIRATATRSVPCLINLAAIDRILNEGKEAPRA